jgi:hypothetical protein
MSTDRDTTRVVRSWLEVGATALPDRVLDAVLDQLPTTPQRRSWGAARRFLDMNTSIKLAIAAAAIVVVAFAGYTLLPSGNGLNGGPGPSSSPSPSPTPSPILNFAGSSYAPRTTYAIEDAFAVALPRMTFTMPATGWYAPLEAWRIGKNVPGGSDIFDLYVTPLIVGNIYTGGCHWRGTELDPPVGPTVDDLATALSALDGASAPTIVTVGGHPGKKVELSTPADLDAATECDPDGGGSDGIFGRFVFDRGFSAHPYTHGMGQHQTIYILDVDGTRQVIDAMYLPSASATDRAEQDQIVASIRFESPAPGPSASATP